MYVESSKECQVIIIISLILLFIVFLFIYLSLYCGKQEEPEVVIARLLSRIRRMYEASISLNFH